MKTAREYLEAARKQIETQPLRIRYRYFGYGNDGELCYCATGAFLMVTIAPESPRLLNTSLYEKLTGAQRDAFVALGDTALEMTGELVGPWTTDKQRHEAILSVNDLYVDDSALVMFNKAIARVPG